MLYYCIRNSLLYQEFDGAIGDITITSNRSRYVDFTLPFSDMGTGTIVRNAKKSMWIFLDPLSANLWVTFASFFLILGFVVWFIEHQTNEEFQGSTRQQIETTLWFAFSTLVYAHRKISNSRYSCFEWEEAFIEGACADVHVGRLLKPKLSGAQRNFLLV